MNEIIHYRRKFIIPNNNKNGKDEQPEWTRINEWINEWNKKNNRKCHHHYHWWSSLWWWWSSSMMSISLNKRYPVIIICVKILSLLFILFWFYFPSSSSSLCKIQWIYCIGTCVSVMKNEIIIKQILFFYCFFFAVIFSDLNH